MIKLLYNKFTLLVLIIGFLLLISGPVQATSTLANFDQAWSDYDENYSYFVYKGIDWDQVKNEYRPFFEEEMDGEEFASKLGEMLKVLHDGHVWVRSPSGKYFYNWSYEKNYPHELFTRYTKSGEYKVLGKNVIQHSIVDNNIAYIVVDTFSSTSFSSISDNDIENLFILYGLTDGMIIDVRSNAGGPIRNAEKVASHFILNDAICGYYKFRIPGFDHNAFTEISPYTVKPSVANYYDGPVVCLIGEKSSSSSEWLALMMRQGQNVTLMGDHTGGVTGAPKEFSLLSGVSYNISTWVGYTDQMIEFEDRGIEPNIKIEPKESFNDERDFVLERAISVIKAVEDGCVIVHSNFDIPMSCVDYSASQYRFTLEFFKNVNDQNGLYWKMNTDTLAEGNESYSNYCINVGTDLMIVVSCAEYDGNLYEFSLDFYHNPSDPSGLYWNSLSSP